MSVSTAARPTVQLPRPHRNQARILEQQKRFNVLACGRRWGKTNLAINLVCLTAIAGRPAAWFAPEYKLLTDAWREMKRVLAPAIARSEDTEKRIELLNGGTIDAWSFDRNPNAGRSRKYARVVVDEAAHADNLYESWTKAIRPTLTDFRGDAWFLSSPNGRNYFHELYQRGAAGEPGWVSWTQTSYDNPLLDPSEIDGAKADLPPLVFRQEYLAEFLDDVAVVLIPPGWLDRCLVAKRAEGYGGPAGLAIDVSKGTGRDRMVAMVGDDLGMTDLVVSRSTALPEAAVLARDLSVQHGIPHDRITYDAGGWAGSDLRRYLEALGIMDAVPFYGSASGGSRYKNRRTRSAWALRQRLDPDRERLLPPPKVQPDAWPIVARTKVVVPPRAVVQPAWSIPASVVGHHWDDLREELSELRYSHGGLKIELEKKELMQERLGRSPDLADAAIMLASLWDLG